jgi:hypothetical protein
VAVPAPGPAKPPRLARPRGAIVESRRQARNGLVGAPGRIASITRREWARAVAE